MAILAHTHECLGLHAHAFQGSSDDEMIRIHRTLNSDRSFVTYDKGRCL